MDDAAHRREFAVPAQSGIVRGIDLSLLHPDDPDERSFLIEAEHPELAEAVERGDDGVFLHGEEMNPRLHLTFHEVITNQLWDDDPPEVWQTAKRLLELGYERHEIFHMLGSAFVPQLWRALDEGKPSDPEEYLRALDALPDSWERKRPSRMPLRRKAVARVRKAQRQARKRGRRGG